MFNLDGRVTTRTRAPRLDPEERRSQLIELGLRMLSSESPDRVPVDEIAEAAGISRGLLFHYFPTKRDFYVAVAQEAARQLLEPPRPARGRPPRRRSPSTSPPTSALS